VVSSVADKTLRLLFHTEIVTGGEPIPDLGVMK